MIKLRPDQTRTTTTRTVLAYLWSRRFEVRISAGEAVIAVNFGGSRKAAPSVIGFLDQLDAAAWTARVIQARGQLPVRPDVGHGVDPGSIGRPGE